MDNTAQEIFDEIARKKIEQDSFNDALKNKSDKKYNSYSEYGKEDEDNSLNDEKNWDKNKEYEPEEECEECGFYLDECKCCYECGCYECECCDICGRYSCTCSQCDYCDEYDQYCECEFVDCCDQPKGFCVCESDEQDVFDNAIKNMRNPNEQELFKQARNSQVSSDQGLFDAAIGNIEEESQNEFEKMAKISKAINGNKALEESKKWQKYLRQLMVIKH